jgi:hypothetical protein
MSPNVEPHNRFEKLPRFRRASLALGIGFVLLIVLLLLLELVLRIYYRQPLVERYFSPAENISQYGLAKSSRFEYVHDGRTVAVSIDSEGRRIVPGAPEQAATTLYVIGDSQAFGWGLNDSESIPARLQHRLGPEWRIVNLGVPGYGPFQYAEELSQIPDGAMALVIQTEANDMQDALVPRAPIFSRCGYLVPRGWMGRLTPCFLLSSYTLATVLDIRNKVGGQLGVPVGFNPHAQVAAKVLSYRIENLYRSAVENKSLRVVFTAIPWDAEIDTRRLSSYRPVLSQAHRFAELRDDCGLDGDFLREPQRQALFQNGDSHLSATGADFVAEKLAPAILRIAAEK